jgi:ATP diphosphatase
VNLTRHLKHHPESALTRANQKFSRRFQGVEALAKQEGQSLDDYTLSELDRFWEQVKLQEKNQGSD